MVNKLFHKKSSGSDVTKQKYQLANELHRQIIQEKKSLFIF